VPRVTKTPRCAQIAVAKRTNLSLILGEDQRGADFMSNLNGPRVDAAGYKRNISAAIMFTVALVVILAIISGKYIG